MWIPTRRGSFEFLVGVGLSIFCVIVWMPHNAGARTPLRAHADSTWSSVVASGHPSGAAKPRMEVVVFDDFQCPYCRDFDPVLRQLVNEEPDVQVRFRHFPLVRLHHDAFPAAVASECAAQQGRFESFRELVFKNQEEIGDRPWKWFAEKAHVADLEQFEKCRVTNGPAAQVVKNDMEAGRAAGVHGTPTVYVNGFLLNRPPTLDELRGVAARNRADTTNRR